MIKAKSINILGEEYEVKHVDTGEDNGYWCPDKTIEISDQITEQEEYLRVLIHECLHGVIHESGLGQDISISQEHCFIDPTINFLFKNFEIKLKRKKK